MTAANVLQNVVSGLLEVVSSDAHADRQHVDTLRECGSSSEECPDLSFLHSAIVFDGVLMEEAVEEPPSLAPLGAVGHASQIPFGAHTSGEGETVS